MASPVCQPNRASLMTGRMPSLHDVRSNGISLSMDNVTFVDLLRDAGLRNVERHFSLDAARPVVRRVVLGLD